MKTALRVNTDFTTEVLDLSSNEYDQLSTSVGGLIQVVPLRDDLYIVVNEEGKLVGLPINLVGTHMWNRSYGETDVMMGDVVFIGATDDEGETLPLSLAWVTQIQELAAKLRKAYLGEVSIVI
jgi:hypothetical protein